VGAGNVRLHEGQIDKARADLALAKEYRAHVNPRTAASDKAADAAYKDSYSSTLKRYAEAVAAKEQKAKPSQRSN